MNTNIGRHILIVHDDILTSNALKDHLEQRGYFITLANSGGQALSELRSSGDIDLMILDGPVTDRIGVNILQVMANDPALPRPPLILSANASDPTRANWEAMKGQNPRFAQKLLVAYVAKPYTIPMMEAMINLILSSSSPRPDHPNTREVISGDPVLEVPDLDTIVGF
jgi:CheY-like chemotaxis protein